MTAACLPSRDQRQPCGLRPHVGRSSGHRLWDPALLWALSPLLAIYVCVTLWSWPDRWIADELRYVRFASNLCQGRYALADDDYLWNGPGFPLILAAWTSADLPARWARNAASERLRSSG